MCVYCEVCFIYIYLEDNNMSDLSEYMQNVNFNWFLGNISSVESVCFQQLKKKNADVFWETHYICCFQQLKKNAVLMLSLLYDRELLA